VDVAGLSLALVGAGSAAFSYWLIAAEGYTPLILIPAVVAFTVGTGHLIKREAPRS
jgi:hypothetical protein